MTDPAEWPNVSAQTRKVASEAGWYPGRHYDAVDQRRALEADGYPVVPAWEPVVESLGGLALRWTEATPDNDRAEFEFRADRAIEWDYVRPQLGDWTARAGEVLTPVGHYVDQPAIYLIGESGAIYLGYGTFLVKLGSRIWDAIDGLVNHWEAAEIP